MAGNKFKTWQDVLNEEKLQRSKGIANEQVAELVQHMRELDIPTAWDVQPAYDADFLGLKDRCHFGLRGLCCRPCPAKWLNWRANWKVKLRGLAPKG